MTERVIYLKLNEALKRIQKHIPVENIFGIFLLDTYDEINEIECEAVIIPNFDDICISTKSISGQLENVQIFDIRGMYTATKDGHPELIGALDTEFKIINPMYQHIFQKLYKANAEAIKAGAQSGVPAPELKTAIIKLCRLAWREASKVWSFIKTLSDSEKLALDGIVKTIGDEGTFSQAKVASAVGVSRLTMSNLVMKLKFYNIADVTYLGNKGTYIKFIDDTVLNIKSERMR